ncbi:NADH-quinone oxidoreductase subunit M [Parachlamydia sp. AcF125]|uniref:complex I subunit 4 family protein n=1 Tax=Parachlamydia sp. AcF125 TaxID=2795736 RepID=UPI001BC90081|nr:NADH-quinone oxidoreductase subunit M [Parachlamydia sp. AcF125]MBS4167685.1 NADH-quinone oxidoreductase subunit M [Parachlamydia sp. AcF125]
MQALLALFSIPFLAAILIVLLPIGYQKFLKRVAFLLGLLPLGMLLYHGAHLNGSSVQLPWLQPLSIEFYLRVDTLSLLFLYLTAVIIPVAILSAWGELPFPKIFYALVLILQGLLIGFFTARDLALFTIFWEAMLIPLYLMINLWGGPHGQSAALRFLVYMIAGSAFMILAVLALYFSSSSSGPATFNLDALTKIAPNLPYASGLCAIFLLAFSVKTPLFPFHAWQPDAYCQASTSGTILLSSLLSKAGIYGILRVSYGLFPTIMQQWNPCLLGLALVGVVYGGLAAWRQQDFKRLIAYSSLSHVNFILAGLFIWSSSSQTGAILQALNHGVTIAGLFLVIGWLEERVGTTSMREISGLAKYFPQLCWITLMFVLASVALPGTNNFIGELLILYGLFSQNAGLAGFLSLAIVLSVTYMLRFMQKVYFENPTPLKQTGKDVSGKQMAVAFPLIALILWIGLYPDPLLKQIESISPMSLLTKSQEAP